MSGSAPLCVFCFVLETLRVQATHRRPSRPRGRQTYHLTRTFEPTSSGVRTKGSRGFPLSFCASNSASPPGLLGSTTPFLQRVVSDGSTVLVLLVTHRRSEHYNTPREQFWRDLQLAMRHTADFCLQVPINTSQYETHLVSADSCHRHSGSDSEFHSRLSISCLSLVTHGQDQAHIPQPCRSNCPPLLFWSLADSKKKCRTGMQFIQCHVMCADVSLYHVLVCAEGWAPHVTIRLGLLVGAWFTNRTKTDKSTVMSLKHGPTCAILISGVDWTKKKLPSTHPGFPFVNFGNHLRIWHLLFKMGPVVSSAF